MVNAVTETPDTETQAAIEAEAVRVHYYRNRLELGMTREDAAFSALLLEGINPNPVNVEACIIVWAV